MQQVMQSLCLCFRLQTSQFLATNNLATSFSLLERFSALKLLPLPEVENEAQGTKSRDSEGDSGRVAGGTKPVVKGELPGMLLILAPRLVLLPGDYFEDDGGN